jgi:enamine deaminase RidA (YjgF/YER057c/UK114 family)
MTGTIDRRLSELGIVLPQPPAPVASYVPYVTTGHLVFISGQIPLENGQVRYAGTVGKDMSLDDGKAAARMCGINLIAQLKAACGGDLDRVRRCIRLGVFVNAVVGFGQHPEVANGVSDLMLEIFGDNGRHARAAVGAGSLPRNVAVEVEGVFEIA